MSSLHDRSNSPRPAPRRTGGMHPGWKCFSLAWFSGMMTTLTVVYAAVHMDRGFLIYGAIAIVLFMMGGKVAEGLWDTKQ